MQEFEGFKALWDAASDAQVLGAAVVVYLALRFLNRIVVVGINRPRVTVVWMKILPFLPEILSVGGVLLGGVPFLNGKSIEVKVGAALWIAYLAIKARKIIGQTVLGDDKKLEDALKKMLSNGESNGENGTKS